MSRRCQVFFSFFSSHDLPDLGRLDERRGKRRRNQKRKGKGMIAGWMDGRDRRGWRDEYDVDGQLTIGMKRKKK